MRIIFLSILGLSLLASCDIINPDEDPVAFIQINDIALNTANGEGQPTEDIRDVWLNIDGDLIGVYEMPVTIPVVENGAVNIKAFGGILDNGISTTRERYPFYDFYEVDVNLSEEQTLTIEPVISYIEDALSFHIEDFEDVSINMVRSLTSDTIIERIDNPLVSDFLQEEHIGIIHLDETLNHFKVESTFDIALAGEALAYIELDYKVTSPFRVGLKRIFPSEIDINLVGFNPVYDVNGDPAWNKVYVNIADAIDILQNAQEYEIFLEADYNGSETATYMFDNIKVIYPD